jgi:hypothetical protein
MYRSYQPILPDWITVVFTVPDTEATFVLTALTGKAMFPVLLADKEASVAWLNQTPALLYKAGVANEAGSSMLN